MATENFTGPSNSDIALVDSINEKTERAACVLGLIAKTMESSELLPAMRLVIDELATINDALTDWLESQSVKA